MGEPALMWEGGDSPQQLVHRSGGVVWTHPVAGCQLAAPLHQPVERGAAAEVLVQGCQLRLQQPRALALQL